MSFVSMCEYVTCMHVQCMYMHVAVMPKGGCGWVGVFLAGNANQLFVAGGEFMCV